MAKRSNQERDEERSKSTLDTITRSKEFGITEFQVSIHDNPCSICAPYQGKVFSVREVSEFPPLTKRPPFCAGCRLILLPYVRRPGQKGKEIHAALVKLSNQASPIANSLPGFHEAVAETRAEAGQ